MIKGTADSFCTGCMLCAEICPKQCISFVTREDGFRYPKIDETCCIGCNKCGTVCPKESPNLGNRNVKAYAAFNRDDEIRRNSSSGGVFHAIANAFIGNGGIVYGAAFDGDFRRVRHIRVDRGSELIRLIGSKYIQSEVESAYADIRQDLRDGRKILFVGTPCQVAAVRELAGHVESLYTIDLICHGVASPMIWERYFDSVHKGKKIKSVFMRDKKYGWNYFSMRIGYEDGKVYRKSFAFDLFLRGFLENLFLRESCYSCPFRHEDRLGDLTVADFWGYSQGGEKGVSLIGVQSEKGCELLDLCRSDLELTEVSWEEGIKTNSAAKHDIAKPTQREKLFRSLHADEPFAKTIRRFLKKRSLKETVYYKLKERNLNG